MNKFYDQQGSSLIEIIAALVIFSLAAAGLAIAIPMAYSRLSIWRGQFDLGRYLETQLEDVRSRTFADLSLGDSGLVDDGDYKYRWVTGYVRNDEGNHTWADSGSGSGDGLSATYYDNPDFTGNPVKQIDHTIDFNWNLASPFSVRWFGYVEPQYNETYTFYINVDNMAKLWVNGTLLIDQTAAGEGSGSIDLMPNVRYQIRMDYPGNTGAAYAQLSWSSLSVLKGIIPQSSLYSSTAKMTVVTVQNAAGTMSMNGRVMTFDYGGVIPTPTP
jgi:prepilin-type N-terminal cleavage/methylation domain-containing protein